MNDGKHSRHTEGEQRARFEDVDSKRRERDRRLPDRPERGELFIRKRHPKEKQEQQVELTHVLDCPRDNDQTQSRSLRVERSVF
jgi:hypothetical protein